MKGMIAVWMAIMVIYFISKLLKYLHKRNTPPQQKLACNCFPKNNILIYILRVLLCRGGNIQFRCQKISATYFLICLHCTYLLLFERKEPENVILLRVCLPDCVRVTNRPDQNRWAKRGYSWSLGIGKRMFLIVGSKSY